VQSAAAQPESAAGSARGRGALPFPPAGDRSGGTGPPEEGDINSRYYTTAGGELARTRWPRRKFVHSV